MLERIYGFTSRLFNLAEETRRNREDIKELQQSHKQTQQELRDLTAVVQRFAFETQRRYENEVHEREKMELRLQNVLLRSDRSLTPGKSKDEQAMEALHKQMELLKQENEELRKRLEQLEKP
jgi:hypothetical protein